jgi:L-rhamnose mutarotase
MREIFTGITVLFSLIILASCGQNEHSASINNTADETKVTKRIGMVIGLKADKVVEYKEVHADSHPGVRDLLNKYNMQNFSIFLHQFDNGNYYLFGYYEYTGENYEADMAELAKEERNIEWLSMTDPMQISFGDESSWTIMEIVYYNP